jgi:ribonuclease R
MMSLTGDAYTFDAQKQLITNGQQTHRIGDDLTVVLKSVDFRARKMSFEVAQNA